MISFSSFFCSPTALSFRLVQFVSLLLLVGRFAKMLFRVPLFFTESILEGEEDNPSVFWETRGPLEEPEDLEDPLDLSEPEVVSEDQSSDDDSSLHSAETMLLSDYRRVALTSGSSSDSGKFS